MVKFLMFGEELILNIQEANFHLHVHILTRKESMIQKKLEKIYLFKKWMTIIIGRELTNQKNPLKKCYHLDWLNIFSLMVKV